MRKRPAAAAAAEDAAKRNRITVSGDPVAGWCQMIIAALKDSEGLADARNVLKGLAKGKTVAIDEGVVRVVGAELERIDDELQATVCHHQSKVEEGEAHKKARMDAQAAAEAKVIELKQAILDRKEALAEFAKKIDESMATIANIRDADKRATAEVRAAELMRAQLEAAKEAVEPLKAAPAKGPQGQKRLSNLRNIGKQFGFHDVMLAALPAVLRKPVDRRQTFDLLTTQQLEVEIDRHAKAAEATVRDNELAASQREEAMHTAKEALAAARKARREVGHALGQAEKDLAAAKESVQAARRYVASVRSEMKGPNMEFLHAKKTLSAFRSGPLAAYQALRARFPPPKVPLPPQAELEEQELPTLSQAGRYE